MTPPDPFMEDTRRYEAAAYDHGFKSGLGHRFEDLDEALICAAQHRHENGRVTGFTGRNQRDVTWLVRDRETGVLHRPGPEHTEAAEGSEAPDAQAA